MKKVEVLGTIKKKYSSGIAETDKGYRFPNLKCEIGDVMLDVENKRIIVSKETFDKEYKADAKKYEKAKKEQEEKAKKAKEEMKLNFAEELDKKEMELKSLKAQVSSLRAENKKLKDELKAAQEDLAKVVVELSELKDDEEERNA